MLSSVLILTIVVLVRFLFRKGFVFCDSVHLYAPPHTNHYITTGVGIYCLIFFIDIKVGRSRQSKDTDVTKTY